MNNIALYDTIRKIPGVTDNEAKEAVINVASSKDMATKADIKDMATKADLKDMATKADVEKMGRVMVMWVVSVGVVIMGVLISVLMSVPK